MLRLHLTDAAITVAKSRSHAEVTPHHVVHAIATHFRGRPEAARFLARTRDGLGPHGAALEPPVLTVEAREMLDAIASAEDAIGLLGRFLGDGDGDATIDAPDTRMPPEARAGGGQSGPVHAAPRSPEETVEDVLAELDRLVGLDAVGAQVRGIISTVRANRKRAEAGQAPVRPGLHLVFTGAPGTGKTTVARLIARLYAACGALPGSKLTEVGRSDLVAGYVGQTAQRTAEVIARSRPGVLFIDEAYALAPTHGSDYGAEAIAILVKAMEDHRHDLAVIVAGYEDEMELFLGSNPGLRSRLQTVVHFPDYTPEELTRIFERLATGAGIRVEESALETARRIFREAARDEGFGNARFARSLFERAYASMAVRAAEDGTVEMAELVALGAEDLNAPALAPPSRARRIGFREPGEPRGDPR